MRGSVSSYSRNMTLNEREILVVTTKIVCKTEKESLKFMKDHEHEMSASTYYRILGHVEGQTRQRLYEIAKSMKELHMQRIDELEKVRTEMWSQYHKECNRDEGKPILAVRILKEIKEVQPYISAYHEATQKILEDTVKKFAYEENIDLSSF